jgi:hypothetical protein
VLIRTLTGVVISAHVEPSVNKVIDKDLYLLLIVKLVLVSSNDYFSFLLSPTLKMKDSFMFNLNVVF